MDKAVRDLYLRLRTEAALTQDDIEERAGVSQGLVSRIEKDASYQPSTDVFFRAVSGLGMSLSAFFLQLETGAKSAIAQPQSVAPALPESETQAPDAHFIRQLGVALLATARHEETLTRTDQPDRPPRRRKSKAR